VPFGPLGCRAAKGGRKITAWQGTILKELIEIGISSDTIPV
jgi:hypothetical protein